MIGSRSLSVCNKDSTNHSVFYLLPTLKVRVFFLPPTLPPSLPHFSLLPDQLSGSGELSGVHILEEERAWLVRARREVESQAKKMLMQGLELMVSTACVVGKDIIITD